MALFSAGAFPELDAVALICIDEPGSALFCIATMLMPNLGHQVRATTVTHMITEYSQKRIAASVQEC